MSDRVLFVDDDRALLNMLERNFALDFEVITAQSGPEALAIIEQSEPFAVTMVDMRMPGMEGTEVITRARQIAPDSSYIMLTGNQDLATAVDAVNNAGVLRFLNKPCEITTIHQALTAGIQHYEATTGQKALLNKTFTGAISVLNEMIDKVEDSPAEAGKIKVLAERFAEELGFKPEGAMPWAARFLVCGMSLLTREQRDVLIEHPINSAVHIKAVRHLVEASLGLIRRIPRLESVVEILEAAIKCDGSLPRPESASQYYATLLMVSLYINLLRHSSTRELAIPGELKKRYPALDRDLNLALQGIVGFLESEQSQPTEAREQRAFLSPEELQEGMIVAADVKSLGDLLLVAKGRSLTAPMIDRLRRMGAEKEVKVEVILKPAASAVA